MDLQVDMGAPGYSIYIEKYGPRRQWIVFAQTGMALTLGSLLLVPDLNGQIDLVARILFVHNIFSSLQDVATDALAVEVLEPDEVAKVNGLMFAAKRVGIIFGGAVLGVLITKIGILKLADFGLARAISINKNGQPNR